MKQLYRKRACLVIPGAGETDEFDYSKGGWQGGVNTPDEFNAIVQHYLSDTVASWNAVGHGMRVDDAVTVVNHFFFADNGFFLAESLESAALMIQQVTDVLYAIGFKWKLSSLQFVLAGELRGVMAEMHVIVPDGTIISVQQVFQMEVLGALVCDDASQRQSLDYRLGKAEAVFHKHQKILRAKGSHVEKMRAWDSTSLACASYCSGALALTKELAHHAHSWNTGFCGKSYD